MDGDQPQVADKDGERGRNRTSNLLIKSQLLCQLSYAPAVKNLSVGQFVIVAFLEWTVIPDTTQPIGYWLATPRRRAQLTNRDVVHTSVPRNGTQQIFQQQRRRCIRPANRKAARQHAALDGRSSSCQS
jgi:hypothetical protein